MKKTAKDAQPKILPCSCPSDYQDTRYGKGNRVKNWGPKASAGKSEGYRCTACGRGH